jgi:hypothetical protein
MRRQAFHQVSTEPRKSTSIGSLVRSSKIRMIDGSPSTTADLLRLLGERAGETVGPSLEMLQ